MPDDPHSLVAPYALDALDEREEKEFEEHLALCERCREELAGLREAAAVLAVGAPPAAPPPELRQRILDQARSERPNVVPLRRPRRWTPVLAATTAVAAAAAVGATAFGVVRVFRLFVHSDLVLFSDVDLPSWVRSGLIKMFSLRGGFA